MRSGIALQDLDPSVSPADDLFGYANGTWLRTTTIPSDRPGYGSFLILADAAEEALRDIADEAAATGGEPGSAEQWSVTCTARSSTSTEWRSAGSRRSGSASTRY